jgi:hypothetical protein
MAGQAPLPLVTTCASVGGCVVATTGLLTARRVPQPRTHVGQWLRFGDGSGAYPYRETVIDRPAPSDPTVLVVGFRLRVVRGRGHDVFRSMSLLNTALFVGFPGFVSSCGWLMTNMGSIEGSTSGMELSKPRTTREPCGVSCAGQRSGHHPLPCAARSGARRPA